MTGTDVVVDSELESITHLDEEWAIACEIPRRLVGTPFFRPHDDLAQWVMWRSKCCPASPIYLLVCDHCRHVYEDIVAKQGYISCRDCDEECFIVTFTELNRAPA